MNLSALKQQVKKDTGFTLIELLVVIAIISILAAAVIIVLNPGAKISASKDGRVKGDLNQIATSLSVYYTDAGSGNITGVSQSIYPDTIPHAASEDTTVKDSSSLYDPYGATSTTPYTYKAFHNDDTTACGDKDAACTNAYVYSAGSSTAGQQWCWKSTTGTIVLTTLKASGACN